jgi:nucleoside-diphosphate-sugar epimerase/predicted dehydrogenase
MNIIETGCFARLSARNNMRYTILGGGSVTAEYYLPALKWMGLLKEVTVVEPDRKSLDLLREFSAGIDVRSQSYQDYFSGVQSAEVSDQEHIIVALPNVLHASAVCLGLEHGGHILCEKPLALTAGECSELAALASRKGRLLKVAMSRRYLPSLMLAREMVSRREFGEVRAIEVRDCEPFGWRPRSFAFFAPEAGGILADMGVHYLDYLETLVGPLRPLAYMDDSQGGIESTASYTLAAGDLRIAMRLSRIEQSGAYIRIACECGEIYIDKNNEREVLATPAGRPSRRISVDHPFGSETNWPRSFQGSFCQMLVDFSRAVRGQVTAIADVADAERAAALIEWAYERRRPRGVAPAQKSRCPDASSVMITGATGFIGGHLVERLSTEGAAIRITARRPENCANVARFPVQIVPTDLLDMDSVRRVVAGVRTVYHLAYGTDGPLAARVTIEGTKNVVEAAIEAGAECVVILSTMYVFGFPDTERPVDESFPYRPYGGEYGRSKAAMERWCLARAQKALATRIVILTPTCVFGPGGGAYTSQPVELARNRQFCWVDGGTGLCNYTYVENLVDAMLAAARLPEAHGNRFIINDGHVSWREFLGPLVGADQQFPCLTMAELQALNQDASAFKLRELLEATISAPQVRAVARRSGVIRGLAKLMKIETSGAGVGRASNLGPTRRRTEAVAQPPGWLAVLYNPSKTVFSSQKANDVLRWQPRVDLTSALSATVRWLEETGQLPAGTRGGG